MRHCYGAAAIPQSRWQERLACYKEEAKKPGPAGEHAQHALARYLRDDVVDLTAALAAFEGQRARYPRGVLRTDADWAVIELLPRLGRHAEALVESQSFLDAHPDAADRAELRLMRGDIYRAIFGDLASAEHEYDESANVDEDRNSEGPCWAPCEERVDQQGPKASCYWPEPFDWKLNG